MGFNANTRKLTFSYRSTRQIYRAAYDLLDKFPNENGDKENLIHRKLKQNDEGIKPILIKVSSQDKFIEKFSEDIKNLLKIYSLKDIMIIIPSDKYLNDYLNIFKKKNLPTVNLLTSKKLKEINKGNKYLDDASIKAYNLFNVKGLEAKIVILLGLEKIPEICKDKEDYEIVQLYHVAMSRAMNILYMYSVGEPNKYVNSIEKTYIKEILEDEKIDIIREVEKSKEYIDVNKVKRYEKEKELIEEKYNKNRLELEKIKELQEKNKEEVIKLKLENEKLKKDTKNVNKEKNLFELLQEEENKNIDKVRKKFPNFPSGVIELLGKGYFYFNQKNIEIACREFVLAIEKIFKEIDLTLFKPLTFGQIISEIESEISKKDYIPNCQIVRKKGIIKIRNKLIHENSISQEQGNILYNYIFVQKELELLYRKVINERERIKKLEENTKIEKIADLTTENNLIKIKRRDYYSFLLNDMEYGICKNKIKNGNYKLSGYYIKSYDRDIFVIENFILNKLN